VTLEWKHGAGGQGDSTAYELQWRARGARLVEWETSTQLIVSSSGLSLQWTISSSICLVYLSIQITDSIESFNDSFVRSFVRSFIRPSIH
jgi:hypothetical protein